MRKLNGWRRLLVVLSVVLAFPIFGIAIVAQQDTSRIEDAAELAQLDESKLPPVQSGFSVDVSPGKAFQRSASSSVVAPSNVPSPESASKNPFDQFDKDVGSSSAESGAGLGGSPSSMTDAQLLAALRRGYEQKAAEARVANQQARMNNRNTWAVAVIVWGVLTAVIYACGAAVGWIAAGFKNNDAA